MVIQKIYRIVVIKMKNIIVKLYFILIIIVLQMGFFPPNVRADDIFDPAENFLKSGQEVMHGEKREDGTEEPGLDELKLKEASSTIFNVFFAIGTALTVIIGGILGIRFMMASAEDKAQIKEIIIPYIVGCIAIFGAFAIWKLVIGVLQNV